MIIKKDKTEIQPYLEDTSNLAGKASILYIPSTSKEVCSLVKDCASKKMPLTIAAGGTGTTGARVPLEGAVLSIEKFDKVLDIDTANNTVKVQSGVTLADLEKKLNRSGLTLRAQPTEPLAFVGGVVSTCASGPRSFKYDSIRRYVRSLKVVFSCGNEFVIERGKYFSKDGQFDFVLKQNKLKKEFKFNLPSYISPKIKSSAGYFVEKDMDFVDLFIGQEGTLGVITEVEFFVQPLVYDMFNAIVFFSRDEDALNFVNHIKTLRKSGSYSYPCSVEFFDRNSLRLLKEFYPSMPFANAAVYFEQEIEDKHKMGSLLDYWCEVIEKNNSSIDNCWFAETKKTIESLSEFRHKLPQQINEILRSNKQIKVATDIAVPDESFRKMYDFYKKEGLKSGIEYLNFGHIGQNHLHFNFLPKNEEESFKAKGYVMEFIHKAVSLKGTISAEHGIGKIKKPYLEIMYDKKHLKEMAALKKVIDPHCIFGLDNIISKELL